MPIVGAHVSAAGGFDKAMERAAAIGADSAQIFSGSPRVWARRALSEINLKSYFEARSAHNISPVVTHSIYLINAASENPIQVEKSAKMIAYDLAFDAAIEGGGVVVHLGSHQGRGWDAVKDGLVTFLKKVLSEAPENCKLLLENSAGQEGKLLSNLSEMRWLFDAVKSPKLGWCVDTCHSFCAGYALGESATHLDTSARKLSNERQRTLVEEISYFNLWDELGCVHVNDSRDPFGSGRDRHANLGDGVLQSEDLAYFLTQPQLADKACILEVPGADGNGPDVENIEKLRKLLQ